MYIVYNDEMSNESLAADNMDDAMSLAEDLVASYGGKSYICDPCIVIERLYTFTVTPYKESKLVPAIDRQEKDSD